MRLLSIDPSLNNCGIAIIIGGEYQSSYTFRTDEEKRVEERIGALGCHFREVGKDFDQAIIELPSSFIREGNFGLKNVRSIQMLHLSIGAIIGGLCFYPDLKIELVKVQDWKGQTPKEQTQAYARGLTGKALNTHEADALMMGLKWLSELRFKRAVREATKTNCPDDKNPFKRKFLRT